MKAMRKIFGAIWHKTSIIKSGATFSFRADAAKKFRIPKIASICIFPTTNIPTPATS